MNDTKTICVDEKQQILDALYNWVRQPVTRPDGSIIGDVASSHIRETVIYAKDAISLIEYVSTCEGITAEHIVKAAQSSFSGRLVLEKTNNGYRPVYKFSHCWPSDYRAAICGVLAKAIWDSVSPEYAFEYLRRITGKNLSKETVGRWF
jgi:hypothetical protein